MSNIRQVFRKWPLAGFDVLVSRPNIERLSEAGNARQGFVSRAELDRIVAHLPEYLQDVVLFAFLSSWRRAEILSLAWSDVDGDTVRLRAVHSKEREARSLVLEGELADLIAPWISEKWPAGLPPRRPRHHRHAQSLGHGLPHGGRTRKLFHDLRRSGVRDLIRAGVAPHVAMSVSGHKTDSMLRRYAIISDADQRAALRRMQEFRAAELESTVAEPSRVQ